MKRAGKEQASISCWKAAELGSTHGPPRAAGAASGGASCHPETCKQSEDRISLSIPGFATKPWVICGSDTQLGRLGLPKAGPFPTPAKKNHLWFPS